MIACAVGAVISAGFLTVKKRPERRLFVVRCCLLALAFRRQLRDNRSRWGYSSRCSRSFRLCRSTWSACSCFELLIKLTLCTACLRSFQKLHCIIFVAHCKAAIWQHLCAVFEVHCVAVAQLLEPEAFVCTSSDFFYSFVCSSSKACASNSGGILLGSSSFNEGLCERLNRSEERHLRRHD